MPSLPQNQPTNKPKSNQTKSRTTTKNTLRKNKTHKDDIVDFSLESVVALKFSIFAKSYSCKLLNKCFCL